MCFLVWQRVKLEAPSDSEPKHLLWCLNFLKQCSTEHTRKALFAADEKTVRKWTWIFVKLVSNLDVVRFCCFLLSHFLAQLIFEPIPIIPQIIWENRYIGAVRGQTCYVSLDGVDFKILEPIPFETKWFSHKFRAAGLRYEVGLNIRSGDMVWAFGGYPCGQYPDLLLAREAFVLALNDNEVAMADKGYKDPLFITPRGTQNDCRHKLIMSRHETVNKRLRQFKILKMEFRHDRQKHPLVFHAVANLTQLMIENGEPLFNVI